MGAFETISLNEKQAALTGSTILKNASTQVNLGDGQVRDDYDGSQPPSSTPPDQFELPVGTICSNKQTQGNAGLNLTTATSVKAEIFLAGSEPKVPVCSNTDLESIRATVLKSGIDRRRHIEFKNCVLKEGQFYEISISATSSTLPSSGTKSLITNGLIRYMHSPRTTGTLSRSAPDSQPALLLVNKNSAEVPPEQCDRRASPLVIQTLKNEQLSFSSVYRKPIQFNLLGTNAPNFDLAVNQKIPLSWIEQPSFMFVARPSRSANGELKVTGINELFGDNTVGPDGQTSENGYAALKKFDQNHDGYITKQDPVFYELYLWGDRNLDGLATANELKSLVDLKIQVIDLSYDARFKEVDAETGNEIVYKSAVKTADQNILLMFDLWFDLTHLKP